MSSLDNQPHWAAPSTAGSDRPEGSVAVGGPEQATASPWAAPTRPFGSSQFYGPNPPRPDGFYAPPAVRTPRRGRRRLVVAGALVLILLVAGGAVGGYQYLNRTPSLNYQGHKVDAPLAALKQAEAGVYSLTQHQIVNRGADSKCYYAVPATGSKQHRWDVSDGIYCGPVALLDSDPGSDLLHFSLTATPTGSHVSLKVDAASPDSTQTGPFPSGDQLVRPGSGARHSRLAPVTTPTAPPGPADAFLSEAKIGKAKELISAVLYDNRSAMYGTDGGISLDSLMDIPYYGSGEDARSAAPGQRLIAFEFTYDGGGVDQLGKLDLGVSVDGASPRDIPQVTETTNYKVISVPTSAKTVDLVLNSGGVRQTLSLIDGKRGHDNVQVLTRTHYYQDLNASQNLTMNLSQGGDTGSTAVKLTLNAAYLDYFVKGTGGTYFSPNDPTKAWLHIDLTYTADVDPGAKYGVLPSPLMELRDARGQIIQEKNYSTDGGAFYAFQVPANFTGGTLLFGDGPKTFDDGLSEAFTSKFQIPLSFPAG
ncbi:MAG TPA: hypothetical protein VHO01_01660 [Jatrophihabitans sp.]|nr:hypothetical protein [Jatrophihabitans sp.]